VCLCDFQLDHCIFLIICVIVLLQDMIIISKTLNYFFQLDMCFRQYIHINFPGFSVGACLQIPLVRFVAKPQTYFISTPQWRNIISGGPQFKIFEGPLVEVPKAQVERHICTSFLWGSRACSPGKFLNLDSLKYHLFYRIRMVRK
jgi:hypothetical protein